MTYFGDVISESLRGQEWRRRDQQGGFALVPGGMMACGTKVPVGKTGKVGQICDVSKKYVKCVEWWPLSKRYVRVKPLKPANVTTFIRVFANVLHIRLLR